MFSPDEPERYRGLAGPLHERDGAMVLADFEAYREAQRAAAAPWRARARHLVEGGRPNTLRRLVLV